jgi:hypothetical protein
MPPVSDLFPRCFLLVFGQLSVGGFLALSAPPFHLMERGFYKSSAAVFLFAGFLAAAGQTALALRGRGAVSAGTWIEMSLWWAFVAASSTYLASLWGERARFRANAFVATWAIGAMALIASAQPFRLEGLVAIETLLYPLSFLISALLLGAVTTGMLLGHWYLIDRNLPLAPFKRMLVLFAITLTAQATLLVLSAILLPLAGGLATAARVSVLWSDHVPLLTVRLAVGPLASAVLAWMIWQTLKIPQTMAATGLFYIAILSVLVGEFMGRFILFRTSLPL